MNEIGMQLRKTIKELTKLCNQNLLTLSKELIVRQTTRRHLSDGVTRHE